MDNAIEYLRQHARVLQRKAAQQDPAAIAWLQTVHGLTQLSAVEIASAVQRKHCLTAIALKLGAKDWNELQASLCASVGEDFGTLLHVTGYWNIWSASYAEAITIRADHGGYLLPYKRQFMIVEDHYLDGLGIDARDEDWERIGRNWVQPSNAHARDRLAEKLLRQRLQPDA